MAGNENSSWLLRAGSYLGEISALAFLSLPPPHLSSLPLLLAGTGSEILVYDVESGDLLNSFHVFGGIRVYGIARGGGGGGGGFNSRIAVFGEKRVKLFLVHVHGGGLEEAGREGGRLAVDLELVCRLPGFDHWVLDALFVEGDSCLVLGLGDNSLAVWDIAKSKLVLRLHSPERCLLYSLRLWGSNLEALRVAVGTIYNEIIIWKISRDDSFVNNSCHCHHSGRHDVCLLGQQYKMAHFSRLHGHEGSIFRLAWSHDGSRLMSVSDDRSARIWNFSALSKGCDTSDNCGVSTVILYGHDARIWDCYISDTIVLTVGEDCSCRLWGMDGKQLVMIKEHIGRGIWRCLYDPVAEIFVTAGFDSAVKVHRLQLSSFKGSGSVRQNGVLTDFGERTEIFSICSPDASKQLDKMDSKSEYIRCLFFTKEDILYVATNNGFLYYVKFTTSSSVEWIQLAHVSEEAALICMDLVSNSSTDSVEAEDIIAIGDGKGYATVLRVLSGVCKPKVAFSVTWSAEAERQLLGIYWCRSLGCSHLFTADPKGTLKVWGILDSLSSRTDLSELKMKVPLIAVFSSFFGTRIMCLDVSFQEEVLVCGDQRGNLSFFSFPNVKTMLTSKEPGKKIPSVTQFKGAHGISSVSTVLIGTLNSDEIEIRTTGGDGCICYFKLIKSVKGLEFIGMKQVKELSIVRSVVGSSSFNDDLAQDKYAIGFTSTDFIIWSLMDEIKILHVSCGGWRRPYSFYFGDLPEIQNCFAFLKDNTIHIHRLWVPSTGRKTFSKVLHMQFHGREIHTLHFISSGVQDLLIATGCEDGMVRLTRCIQSDMYTWSSSRLLGEHVGGSAVRSLSFVSRMYTSREGRSHTGSARHLSQASSNRSSDQSLLISVGSKQVLTVWLLRNSMVTIKDALTGVVNAENNSNVSREFPSTTFQWLSTHILPKHATSHKETGNLVKHLKITNASTSCPARKTSESKLVTVAKHENDWRYLAVTAFLVKAADRSFTVCFIVVAGSDATLILRAFLLPYRLWFDVAFLVPQASPVLSLQHVVSPLYQDPKDDCQNGNAYVVISGSTDGTITFWDLTEPVEHFMQSILEIQPEKLVDCQRRPRTGRGSQGGRWWKSAGNRSSQNGTGNNLEGLNADVAPKNQNKDKLVSGTASSPLCEHGRALTDPLIANERTTPSNGMGINILAADIYEVRPLLVLDSVHQSGVNCLHVSQMENIQDLESEFIYCAVSGGDDQCLHCTVFALQQQMANPISTNTQPVGVIVHTPEIGYLRKCFYSAEQNQHNLTVLYKNRVTSAHSSAVKGVWTDGLWVFSTGLDQRIRCWHFNAYGKLAEHGQLIISVPEPETLDAVMLNRNQYQIAVAGRGMQMVVFIDPSKDDTEI